ncbi:hypothetical protein AB0B07_28700 [Streptomyces sioyaensis]|uniref:hypothetical protein n=1 Tax=Streptomyces sioyaensis TaxID=67364 RepID=UPI0033FA3F76
MAPRPFLRRPRPGSWHGPPSSVVWWAGQLRTGDVVRGAYGAVPMALVHEVDIAAVAVRALADDGFPDAFVDALLDGHAGMLAAPRPVTTGTIETVTGTPARTFRDWVADHIADFG